MRAFESTDILLKVSDEVKSTKKSSLKISVSSPDSSTFSYSTKAVIDQLIPLPRVPKDNKKYDIYVETMPDKFAPQKKVSHTFKADDYVKSIKLVLNRTDTGLKQSRSVSIGCYGRRGAKTNVGKEWRLKLEYGRCQYPGISRIL